MYWSDDPPCWQIFQTSYDKRTYLHEPSPSYYKSKSRYENTEGQSSQPGSKSTKHRTHPNSLLDAVDPSLKLLVKRLAPRVIAEIRRGATLESMLNVVDVVGKRRVAEGLIYRGGVSE